MSESLQFSDVQVEVESFHHDFLILRSEDRAGLRRVGRALFQQDFDPIAIDFVEEVIVTAAEVLVKLNAAYTSAHLNLLTRVPLPDEKAIRSFEVPVCFEVDEGENDWAAVREQTGFSQEDFIEKLCAHTYSVAMLGFLPGFVYLVGLPEEMQVPRKSVPSKYVKAGSVAIGGKYLGIYALDSPGGWQVIGKTPLQLLETPELPPVAFLPGDEFRIRAISTAEYDHLLAFSPTLSDYHACT